MLWDRGSGRGPAGAATAGATTTTAPTPATALAGAVGDDLVDLGFGEAERLEVALEHRQPCQPCANRRAMRCRRDSSEGQGCPAAAHPPRPGQQLHTRHNFKIQ